MKIFIVDDDYEIIQIMQAALEEAGHQVESHVSGDQAVSAIRLMKPDCVIIDLMMAALNGLELCDEIRQISTLDKAKIVMVSARDAQHWKEKAADHGAIGYITKPFNMATFAKQIDEIINGTA